jgi:hypothetical protein
MLLLATCARAACPDVANSAGYVRAAASGTATGADWTNAYTDLPASLSRGCTYYVAGGSYAAHTFNDADSGTTLIIVKAPTIASHGIATGWSNAYAAQATFTAPIMFTGGTDYYTFSGTYRASTGSPWLDWRSKASYGFVINNTNGSSCAISYPTAIAVGNFNGNAVSSNVTLDYLDVVGSGDFPQTCGSFDWGVSVNGNTSTTNTFYLGHSHIHEQSGDQVLCDGVNGCTVEYNYIERSSEGGPTNHMEEFAARNNTDNLIFRYNFIGACGDTACWATPNSSGARSSWYVYGNIFYVNSAEAPVSYNSGDGVMSVFSLASITGMYFINNTISSLPIAGACGWFPWTPVTTTNVYVLNNLWYNCAQNNNPALQSGVTWDYNAYYTAPTMHSNDTATHTSGIDSGGGSNPFVNVAASANANNFNLTADTTAGTTTAGGTNLSALPTGCTPGTNCMDTDMNGNSRASGTWDRGALQLTGGGGASNNVQTGAGVILSPGVKIQ